MTNTEIFEEIFWQVGEENGLTSWGKSSTAKSLKKLKAALLNGLVWLMLVKQKSFLIGTMKWLMNCNSSSVSFCAAAPASIRAKAPAGARDRPRQLVASPR